MAVRTKWNFEAEYIQSCNCDWGCPCNFNALPTHGNCEALVAYRIKKGKFGDTKLDGAIFGLSAWWPKAIHEGNGTAALYLDENTTSDQRKAIEAIFSGKQGGGVFEIFPKTWSKVLPTKVVKMDFHYDGYNSWFKVDGIGEVRSTYISNPVTGEKFKGEVFLPGGINWKRALTTNIKKWWVGDREIHARHENRAGFVTTLKFSEKGCIG